MPSLGEKALVFLYRLLVMVFFPSCLTTNQWYLSIVNTSLMNPVHTAYGDQTSIGDNRSIHPCHPFPARIRLWTLLLSSFLTGATCVATVSIQHKDIIGEQTTTKEGPAPVLIFFVCACLCHVLSTMVIFQSTRKGKGTHPK